MDTIEKNTLLYTENLSKNFQGIQAVKNVNFKINKNEIRALIGPNGAGKTTFVSLLCGRIKSTARAGSRTPSTCTVGHLMRTSTSTARPLRFHGT